MRWAPANPPPSARLPPAITDEVLMRRIGFAVVLALSLAPLGADAQQTTGQRHRIGLLNGASEGRVEAVFREGLRALGYVEGTNIVIDARAAQGRVERLPTLTRELVDAKPSPNTSFDGHGVGVYVAIT